MGHARDLELLLLARQDGLVTEGQVEEFLKEVDRRPPGSEPPALEQVAVARGWLNPRALRELDRRRTGAPDVELTCVACGRTDRVPILTALRRSRCAECSGPLARAAPAVPPKDPVPADANATAADKRFGKYVLLERIGVGGMGEVWSAWDTTLQRAVALKFPKKMGQEEIRRLYLEARGAGRLTHPNIASVYEVSEGPGRPYIALQLIDGKTAVDATGDPSDPREAARWIRDAARAVHYAHENGVIHRDLKPSNLMIDGQKRVFVMDFGLAKVHASSLDSTVTGILLGTPSYMPPEQASGKTGDVDGRSDVYSLGATLYTLLCGRRPYEGESPTDILLKIISSDPPPLRGQRPDVPLGLESVVLKAMRRDKGRRYATAAAMADDLDRFLAGEPVSAPAAGMTARWTARAKKPIPAWTAVVAMLLVAAGIGALAWWGRPSSPPAAGPDRLAAWTDLYARLRSASDPDAFDEASASALLERVRKDFPEQGGHVAALLDQQHRMVETALAALPRSRWGKSRPKVERYRSWLAFAGRSTETADRILGARPACTIAIDVLPRAEIRGAIAESLPSEERFTPMPPRDLEIAPGPIILSAHGLPPAEVPLPELQDGGAYVLEGRLDEPGSLRWRIVPRPP